MIKVLAGLIALCCLSLVACTKLDVLEKNISFKNQEWNSKVTPTVKFVIEDTTSLYNVFIVMRHTDAYNYSNVWVKCTVIAPGDPVKKTEQYDLTLATNDHGWLGTGMDDIFESRILIQPSTKFTKLGEYQFILQQIMREDPLEHVLNVGLRLEKTQSF